MDNRLLFCSISSLFLALRLFAAGVWTGAGGDSLWTNPANWQDGTVPCTNAVDTVDLTALPPGGNIILDAPVLLKGTLTFSGSEGDVWTISSTNDGSVKFAGATTLDITGGKLDITATFNAIGDYDIIKRGSGEVRFSKAKNYNESSRAVSIYGGKMTFAAPAGINNFRVTNYGGVVNLERDTTLSGLSTDYYTNPEEVPAVQLNGHKLTLVSCDRTRSLGGGILGTNAHLVVDRGAWQTLEAGPYDVSNLTLKNADLKLGHATALCLDFEDASNPIRDSRGGGSRLAIVGTPRVVSDPERGNVCEFDGSSYFKGPDANTWLDNDMPHGNAPFTVAMWLKLSTSVSAKAAVFSWGAPTGDKFAGIRIDNSKNLCYAWYGDNCYFNVQDNDSAWHHVAVTYDGKKTMHVYHDGILLRTINNRAENIEPRNLVIGNGAWSGTLGGAPTTGPFKGWIDDFVIIRGELMSTAIGALSARGVQALDVMLPNDANVAIESGGTLSLNGAQNIATLSGAGLLGGIEMSDRSSITVGTAAAATSTVFEAQIRGNVPFTKSGADYELVMSGANSYTGATTVTAGTLTLKTPVSQPGLMGYWNFEDATSFGYDRSDKGFHLNVNNVWGISAVSDGVIGKAAHFDGSASAHLISNTIFPIGFPHDNGAFTASVWVRPATSTCTGKCPILEWGLPGNNNTCVMLRFDGISTLCFIKIGSQDLRDIPFANGRFDDGEWHHIAITSDGSVQACWIDGVMAKSANLTAPLNISLRQCLMMIARKTAGGVGYYTGDLDEVRVYNRKLSDNEIISEYQLKRPAGIDPATELPKPVAHWDFNDPDNPGKDIGPCGCDLVPVGGTPTLFSDGLTYGSALDLRDSTCYFKQPDGAAFPENFPTGNSPFTISCRIRPAPSCYSGSGAFFWGNSNLGPNRYFIISMDPNVFPRRLKTDIGGGNTVLITPQYGTECQDRTRWMHIVAVYSPYDCNNANNRRCRLFVDGKPISKVTREADLDITPENLFIGRKLSTTNIFQGLIDDIQVFNVALSEGQVRTLTRAFDGEPSVLPENTPVAIAGGAELKVATASAKCGTISGAGTLTLEREGRLSVGSASTFAGTVVGGGALRAAGSEISLTGDTANFTGPLESLDGGRITSSGFSNPVALVSASQLTITDPTSQFPLITSSGPGLIGENGTITWDNSYTGEYVLMSASSFTQSDISDILSTWTLVPPRPSVKMGLFLRDNSLVLRVSNACTVIVVR